MDDKLVRLHSRRFKNQSFIPNIGDIIETLDGRWKVIDRKFICDIDGINETIHTIEIEFRLKQYG